MSEPRSAPLVRISLFSNLYSSFTPTICAVGVVTRQLSTSGSK